MSELNRKIVKATKWSAITEIIAKLITPITSIILARLLTPEAFGVVTTLSMVITFAEIFTDAGFQKYLIQHDFVDDLDREQSTNVAFWSNLVMSLFLWLVIGVFADPLASLVGSPGLGHVLIIACISIPLAAFSTIQIALYKRDLDFSTLFKVRIIGICIPLIVTIPLAFYLRSYWALVIGTIVSNLANAVLLTFYSKWKPKLFYSFGKFKEMFSFSAWSVVEAITIWMTGYVDIFIIGTYLNEYYFKTMHHEFAHILHQKKPYSTDFNLISGSDYVTDAWSDTWDGDADAQKNGFISEYASKEANEDFVELIAVYVTSTAAEWNSVIKNAGDGAAIINAKFDIVYNYMLNTWGINLDDLREVVQRRQSEIETLDLETL